MKLTLHVSPTRTSLVVGHRGSREIAARVTEDCDAIAGFLRDAGVTVQILEEPATSRTDSGCSLIFARDLEWNLTEGGRSHDQLVVLHADRDEILDIVETHRVAAAVHYLRVDAFENDNRALVVRRDIAECLGGTLLPGLPYFKESTHYASWQHPACPSLASRLVAYLEACASKAQVDAPIIVSHVDAKKHGLPAISIRVDLAAAGMYARPFPAKDHYVILNGPPGAPIAVVVWNCTSLPDDDETVIRARFVPPWANELELGAEDRGVLLGAEQTGRLFATGSGQARACWFGVRAQRGAAKVLVALSVGGDDGSSFTAADVLDNAMIHAVVASLRIE